MNSDAARSRELLVLRELAALVDEALRQLAPEHFKKRI